MGWFEDRLLTMVRVTVADRGAQMLLLNIVACGALVIWILCKITRAPEE